jgi:hypothetical protein
VAKEKIQPKLNAIAWFGKENRVKRKRAAKSYMTGKAFFQKGFGDFDGFVRR